MTEKFFIRDNQDRLKTLLWSFNNFKSFHTGKPITEVIEKFLKCEMDQEKGWAEYMKYLDWVKQSDSRILREIRSVKGNSFWKNLLKAIKELGPPQDWAPMQIVKEPIGNFHNEKYGREIKGYWVDQRSVGTEGDSFEGTICIHIRGNKYLKFHYSC